MSILWTINNKSLFEWKPPHERQRAEVLESSTTTTTNWMKKLFMFEMWKKSVMPGYIYIEHMIFSCPNSKCVNKIFSFNFVHRAEIAKHIYPQYYKNDFSLCFCVCVWNVLLQNLIIKMSHVTEFYKPLWFQHLYVLHLFIYTHKYIQLLPSYCFLFIKIRFGHCSLTLTETKVN